MFRSSSIGKMSKLQMRLWAVLISISAALMLPGCFADKDKEPSVSLEPNEDSIIIDGISVTLPVGYKFDVGVGEESSFGNNDSIKDGRATASSVDSSACIEIDVRWRERARLDGCEFQEYRNIYEELAHEGLAEVRDAEIGGHAGFRIGMIDRESGGFDLAYGLWYFAPYRDDEVIAIAIRQLPNDGIGDAEGGNSNSLEIADSLEFQIMLESVCFPMDDREYAARE